MPATENKNAALISRLVAVRGALSDHSFLNMLTMSTSYRLHVDGVNIKVRRFFLATRTPKRSYHHGNLRLTLIQAGLDLIAEQGARALTLRELGKRAGVSRTAAYRHFRDRAALLE